MHRSTLTCAAVGTHRRSCCIGVLACAQTTRISRCARFGAGSTTPQKGCMHQSGTSVCIRLGNDKGRNQISGLVCPLPIYSGGASCPHQTHIHTLRALSPRNLSTHPRDMPCTGGSPSWKSESEDSRYPCTLTQTYTRRQRRAKTRHNFLGQQCSMHFHLHQPCFLLPR